MSQVIDIQQGSERRDGKTASTSFNNSVFWERLWRTGGIQFIALFIIAYVIYGSQPHVGAPADTVVADPLEPRSCYA